MREGKHSFNPCLFNEHVYVCGDGSQLVEAFSPQTDNFLPLQVLLPEANHCCLYVHSNLLVVHSSQYISKFAAGQTGQLAQYSQVRSQTPALKWFNSQPVVDLSRGLFFIFQRDKILSLNMETGDLMQRFA